MLWSNLRNGQSGGNNSSTSLYGWRRYGDKLLKNFARGGETVVQAQSDYKGLGVYAVKGADCSLRILIINKHPTAALNATLSIPALKQGEKAQAFS